MPAYSATVSIDAPPEAVFALVSDLATHDRWSADPLDITQTGDGTYRSTSRSKGKTIEAELTVVESSPPSRFVFDAADVTGRWRHTFALTPTGTGTTVSRVIEGKLSLGQLLLFALVLLPIKKPNAARALRRLKELAET